MSNTQTERAKLMATEKIPKLFASLAIPAVVAQIINLLYNIVDRFYIGHIPGVGASALTGVGLFVPILMLINAFAMLAKDFALYSVSKVNSIMPSSFPVCCMDLYYSSISALKAGRLRTSMS